MFRSSHARAFAALSVVLFAPLGAAAFAADAPAPAAAKPAAPAVPAYVKAAIHDGNRWPTEIARDAGTKAEQTLAFSGIKPGMKVGELVPAGGYYTRLLSKLVGSKGHVYAVIPLSAGVRDAEALRAKQAEDVKAGKKPTSLSVDNILAIQNIADYSNVTALWETMWQYGGQFSTPEQLDAVWSYRSYHDLHIANDFGIPDVGIIDKRIFDAMKPGGVFVIIDNATAKGAGWAAAEKLHRADEDALKQEVLAAGFVLDSESKVLAVAADDHVATGQGADTYTKTDQFVLRFKKPLTAKGGDLRPDHDVLVGFYGNTTISGEATSAQRHVFYHPDHSYQEFGWEDMQSGQWYWDAAGHNCMLHQWPEVQRGFVVCHDTARDKKPGDNWTQNNGQPWQGTARPYKAVQGLVYPGPRPAGVAPLR